MQDARRDDRYTWGEVGSPPKKAEDQKRVSLG